MTTLPARPPCARCGRPASVQPRGGAGSCAPCYVQHGAPTTAQELLAEAFQLCGALLQARFAALCADDELRWKRIGAVERRAFERCLRRLERRWR